MVSACCIAVAISFTASTTPEARASAYYEQAVRGRTERERQDGADGLITLLIALSNEKVNADALALLAASLLYADLDVMEKHNLLDFVGESVLSPTVKKSVVAILSRYRPRCEVEHPATPLEKRYATGFYIDLDRSIDGCIRRLGR